MKMILNEVRLKGESTVVFGESVTFFFFVSLEWQMQEEKERNQR